VAHDMRGVVHQVNIARSGKNFRKSFTRPNWASTGGGTNGRIELGESMGRGFGRGARTLGWGRSFRLGSSVGGEVAKPTKGEVPQKRGNMGSRARKPAKITVQKKWEVKKIAKGLIGGFKARKCKVQGTKTDDCKKGRFPHHLRKSLEAEKVPRDLWIQGHASNLTSPCWVKLGETAMDR